MWSLLKGCLANRDWLDLEELQQALSNNLRLILQPWGLFNLLKPWLQVFPIGPLRHGFSQLIERMNYLPGATPNRMCRASP
ncbi:MAG: hypothetical protein F6K42_00280 [Leptolyngbya sp. SIO1D8]|nr:hypothetical protein [Leptolyngbya sp. SIO1D8]